MVHIPVLQIKLHLEVTISHHYHYCSSVIVQLQVSLTGRFRWILCPCCLTDYLLFSLFGIQLSLNQSPTSVLGPQVKDSFDFKRCFYPNKDCRIPHTLHIQMQLRQVICILFFLFFFISHLACVLSHMLGLLSIPLQLYFYHKVIFALLTEKHLRI